MFNIYVPIAIGVFGVMFAWPTIERRLTHDPEGAVVPLAESPDRTEAEPSEPPVGTVPWD